MTWIRLDDRWDEHPKVMSVSEPAVMMWQRAIAHSNRNKSGRGFVPLGGLARLTSNPEPAKLAEELAKVCVPGCRGGLFDRAVRGADGKLVQLDEHDKTHDGELVGYFVHDVTAYWRAGDDAGERQGKSALSAARSAAGAKGAQKRWHPEQPSHGTESSPTVASATAQDGNLPMATHSNGHLNTGTAIAGAAHGPGLAQTTPRAQAAAHGNLPMAGDGNLLPPVPVPVPMDPSHPSAGARGVEPGQESSLATAEVWLAAIAPHPAFSLLHGDRQWANELAGTAFLRRTRAEDASAAVLVFLDKHAGRSWHDRDELVAAFGGYSARAKQHGDDARARAARAAAPPSGRINGHKHGSTRGDHKGPPPNPRAASQLDLDTGGRKP